MKKAIALLLASLLILSLTACGGENADHEDPNIGLWEATVCEMMGLTMEVGEFFGRGFTIELLANGKCALSIDGEEASGTWTLDNDAFTIKGGGLDCAGRLENGKLTLNNVLDMGLTLVFAKEGDNQSGAATPTAGNVGDDATDSLIRSGSNASAPPSAIQRQWNGTWYGFMMMNSGTGEYEDGATDSDMYMVVDVDPDGNGIFTVYSSDLTEWGKGSCIAKEDVLQVIEGDLTESPDPMIPLDWSFFKVQDTENKFVNTTDFTDFDGDTFNSSIFFKPWGADWQDEVDSGRKTYPPGYEDYLVKINSGEPSPFDGGS